MRKHQIHYRDSKSIVQITNAVKTKDIIKSFAAGKPIELSKGVDSRSFDFPDGKVDFSSSYIEEAPDLIEQSFMKEHFYEHLHPQKSGEPLPPSPSPVVDPSPSPVVDPSPSPSNL